jgi:mannose-6-phosphate isomerase-like protein (cupin superfamily)
LELFKLEIAKKLQNLLMNKNMIIKGKNTDFISRENMDIKIFNKAEDFANASVALIKVKDRHGEVKSSYNDRIYYVIKGKGKFIISGEENTVESGDLIIVRKNTDYDFYGTLTLILVHVPAFKPG